MSRSLILSAILSTAIAYAAPGHSSGDGSALPPRGIVGDWSADVILGQPDFSMVTPGHVDGRHFFNPGGVLRYDERGREVLVVYDSGNNRALGYTDWRTDPAFVLGQPDVFHSGCNGDSAYQSFPSPPAPDAASLCLNRVDQVSITESGFVATMAYHDGVLYVPDGRNDRVLGYIDPLHTDTIADFVWGQPDFRSSGCNLGRGDYARPTRSSLCLGPPAGRGEVAAGVAVNPLAADLAVADTQNHRVLVYRRAKSSPAADGLPYAAIGQPDFETREAGDSRGTLHFPYSVVFSADGTRLFVADHHNARIQAFDYPLYTGMDANYSIEGLFDDIHSLQLDGAGNLLVNDRKEFVSVSETGALLHKHQPFDSWYGFYGGLGVSGDGDIYYTGWDQYLAKVDLGGNNTTVTPTDAIAGPNDLDGPFPRNPLGIAVTSDQVIVNHGPSLVVYQQPVRTGQRGFQVGRYYAGVGYHRMRQHDGFLWAIWGVEQGGGASLHRYQLPLTDQSAPDMTVTFPLPLLGGGNLAVTDRLVLSGIDFQPGCADCMWLSDADANRVFRIRNVSSEDRVVDMVLGQRDARGEGCNHGRDESDGASPMFPTADSVCKPGALSFDQRGRLFVSDHNLEVAGNLRMLVWEASSIPTRVGKAEFGIPADHVLGRSGRFTEERCLRDDPMCGPFEAAFGPNGFMVVGFNGYLGSRFPKVYVDPVRVQLPVGELMDFGSQPTSLRFDDDGNLYVLDHARSRVLVYYRPTGNGVWTTFLPRLAK